MKWLHVIWLLEWNIYNERKRGLPRSGQWRGQFVEKTPITEIDIFGRETFFGVNCIKIKINDIFFDFLDQQNVFCQKTKNKKNQDDLCKHFFRISNRLHVRSLGAVFIPPAPPPLPLVFYESGQCLTRLKTVVFAGIAEPMFHLIWSRSRYLEELQTRCMLQTRGRRTAVEAIGKSRASFKKFSSGFVAARTAEGFLWWHQPNKRRSH